MTVSLLKPDYAGYDPMDAATAAIMRDAFAQTPVSPWMALLTRSSNIGAQHDYQRDIANTNAQLAELQRQKMYNDLLTEGIKVTPQLVKEGIFMGDSPSGRQLFGPGGVTTGVDVSKLNRADTLGSFIQKLGTGLDHAAQSGVYFDPQTALDRVGMTFHSGPTLGVKTGGSGAEKPTIETKVGDTTVRVQGGTDPVGTADRYAGQVRDSQTRQGTRIAGRAEGTAAAGQTTSIPRSQLDSVERDAVSKGYNVQRGSNTVTITDPRTGKSATVQVK